MDYLSKLEKQAIARKNKHKQYFLETSIDSLKVALNLAGLPSGRLIELKGDPHPSLFFFTLQMIKDVQLYGNFAWLIDCECQAEPDLLKQFEIDTKSLIYSQPSTSEETFELICNMLKHNVLDLIVINSVLSLFSLTHNYQWFREKLGTLNRYAKASKTAVVIINPYNTCRYNILGKYASIVLSLKKGRVIKKNDEFLGYHLKGKVLKNNINFHCNTFNCKYLINKII